MGDDWLYGGDNLLKFKCRRGIILRPLRRLLGLLEI
jgi:hypothetical protein